MDTSPCYAIIQYGTGFVHAIFSNFMDANNALAAMPKPALYCVRRITVPAFTYID